MFLLRWRGAFGGLEAGLAGLLPRAPQSFVAGLRQLGLHLAALTGFLAVAAGVAAVGRALLRLVGTGRGAVLTAALGAACASAVWTGLALAGLARGAVAAGWIVAMVVAGWPVLRSGWAHRADLRPVLARWWPVAAMLVLLLPPALVPETEVDSLTYHLALPDGYARAGKMFLAPASFLDGYWQGQEALHLPALLWGCEPAAKLVSLGGALLLAAATVALGRGAVPGSAHPWLAATMLAAPPVFAAATRSKNDALAAALVAAALVARAGGAGRGHAVLAGLLCGAAAGIKSTAAIALPALLLTFALAPAGRRLAPAAIALCAAGIPVLPWLARNGLELGNPLFPALLGSLPAPGLGLVHRDRSDRYLFTWADAAPGDPVGAAAALVAVIGGAAPAIGAGLLLLPFAGGLAPAVRILAWFTLAFVPVWLAVFPWLSRFAVPALAPLTVLAWAALAGAPDAARRVRIAGGTTLIAGVAVALGSPAWTTRPLWCAAGLESRSGFTAAAERTYAEAVRAVVEVVPGDERVLVFGEWKSYPSGGRLQASWIADTPPAQALARACATPARIAVRLRQRRVTHALVNIPQSAFWARMTGEFPWDAAAAGRWAAFWDAHATLRMASSGQDSTMGFFVLVSLRRAGAEPRFRAWLPGAEGEFALIREAAAADPADPRIDPELRRVEALFGPRAEVLARRAGVLALRGDAPRALAAFRAAVAAAPEGRPVWARLDAVPVPDAAGLAAFVRGHALIANVHMALGVPSALP